MIDQSEALYVPIPNVVLALTAESATLQLSAQHRKRLRALGVESVDPVDLEFPDDDAILADAEVLITSWGTPPLTAALLERMPRLHTVLHAAGSVRGIVTEDLWRRGISVTSAARANAVPVADFTIAMITLARKQAHRLIRNLSDGRERRQTPAARKTIVGVVGFSTIGRLVSERLKSDSSVEVLVFDPTTPESSTAKIGARLVALDSLLDLSDIVTLHAPELPTTVGMIGSAQLARLKDGAVIINTARGPLIDTAALVRECEVQRLDAILDVTDPEPLPADHILRRLPNVVITPHIAGAIGIETHRLTDMAIDELERLIHSRPLLHTVAEADLAVRA